MKKLILATLVTLIGFGVLAFKPVPVGKWDLDKSHSNVKFSVTHLLVSETEGTFKIANASVLSDKPDFTDALINFDIDVNSINTDNADRDKHLKSDDFLMLNNFQKQFLQAHLLQKLKVITIN